jgi:hypothetical protein
MGTGIREGFGDDAAGTTGAGRDNDDETADTGCGSDPTMAVGAHSVIHAERKPRREGLIGRNAVVRWARE